MLAAAFVAFSSVPQPARAFVPPTADVSCPRAAMHGRWVAYAQTLNGEEMNPVDRMRSTPRRLELSLTYSKLGKKGSHTTEYEVEALPRACVARTVRYEIRDMIWDLELTSNDELTIRVSHPERGTHIMHLRRVVAA